MERVRLCNGLKSACIHAIEVQYVIQDLKDCKDTQFRELMTNQPFDITVKEPDNALNSCITLINI